jgi:translocation and assembly module TamB
VKRRTVIILSLLVLLCAAPLAALWALGHSEGVLRFVTSRIPERFGVLERFSIRDVRGSIAGGLYIGALDIEHDIVHVHARGIRARVSLLPLLWQSVEAREFSVERIDIEQQRRDRPPPTKPPRFLPGLLTVEARSAKVQQLVIQPLAGNAVEFGDITIDGLLRGSALQVRTLGARLGGMQLSAEGVLRAAMPLGLEGEVGVVYQPRRGPAWRARGEFDGDLAEARFDAELLEPFDAQVDEGELRLLPPWSVRGTAEVAKLDLREFGGGGFLGLIDGRLELQVDRAGYRAQGSLLPPGLGAGPVAVDFDGSYSRGVVTARRIGLNHRGVGTGPGTQVALAGTIAISDSGPRLDLRGDWQQFRWPLAVATPAVRSTRGRFTLAGSGPYAISAAGDARIGQLPQISAAIDAQLLPGRIEITQATADVLGGSARLAGEAAWLPAERWQLKGTVRGLDPGRWRAALPGRLDFTLAANGRGFGSRGLIEVDVSRLEGRLRGTAARGSGRLSFAADTLRLGKVQLAAGGLRLALDGLLSPQRNDFEFRIDADDLGVIADGGQGRLRANGTLRGTPSAMLVKLAAEGNDLRLGDLAVDRLQADIDLDPGGGSEASARAHVEARGLSAFGRTAERVLLDIDGRGSGHSLAVELRGDDLAFDARGEGSFATDGWRQRWSSVDLRLPGDISLQLEEALGLRLTGNSLQIDPFCLRGRADSVITDAAALCASGTRNAGGWNLDAAVTRLPIASLLPAPAARAKYEGWMNASMTLRSATSGLARGLLRAEFDGAALRWQRAGGKSDLIPLGSGSLLVESTDAGLTGNLDIAAAERGRARGELRATYPGATAIAAEGGLPGPQDPTWRDMPLLATIRADSTALALLYLYVPQIDRSSGDLSLDLVVGGTLGAPLVNGVLRLENGEMDFYQVNLALRGLRAEARLLDNGFVLSSSARAGDGSVEADAELTWRDGQPNGELRLRGENLLVIDVPEARITASPDLRFRVTGRDLAATGTVMIPSARIVPADLTGATLVSDDEILVGGTARDPDGGFRVSSNLRLALGERVTLDSFGLSGRLAGTLNVVTTADGVNRGSGELGISEGKYAALGRRLDIERGRLIFTGGLLGDPGVDLRATKEFPDVRAGVNVRGTLREPRMTFFSEPALPQSQVVSLILAGGTLESTQGGGLAGSGRDAILAQGGAILAQQLGQRIGIEDVGIEQNLANETSLVFGKYLSSRLYVSYGVSLAEAINTLKLRYSINDRWTLRTEAGKEASAEIVYTVEKN